MEEITIGTIRMAIANYPTLKDNFQKFKNNFKRYVTKTPDLNIEINESEDRSIEFTVMDTDFVAKFSPAFSSDNILLGKIDFELIEENDKKHYTQIHSIYFNKESLDSLDNKNIMQLFVDVLGNYLNTLRVEKSQ